MVVTEDTIGETAAEATAVAVTTMEEGHMTALVMVDMAMMAGKHH